MAFTVTNFSFDAVEASVKSRRNILMRHTLEISAGRIRCDFFDAAGNFSSLLAYLRSADTRLPKHPSLRCFAADCAEYATYVGEDVWISENCDEHDLKECSLPDAAAADYIVRFARQVLLEGPVVVCGMFNSAVDVAWAMSTQTIACRSVRDVFLALRLSIKLQEDFDKQIESGGLLRISLRRFSEHPPSCEFRAFVGWRASADAPVVLGITQRAVDVCYPDLGNLSRDQHGSMFRAVAQVCSGVCGGLKEETQSTPIENKFLRIFAVDVIFEKEELPILVLSAGVVQPGNDSEALSVSRVFRLFYSLEKLLEHYSHHEGRGTQGIYIATQMDELLPDTESWAQRLPEELLNPNQFACDEETLCALHKLHAQLSLPTR
jgi:hypothetical protein